MARHRRHRPARIGAARPRCERPTFPFSGPTSPTTPNAELRFSNPARTGVIGAGKFLFFLSFFLFFLPFHIFTNPTLPASVLNSLTKQQTNPPGIPIHAMASEQEAPPPPPTTSVYQLDEHEPRGTSEEAATIAAGLTPGSLGQTIALPQPRLVHDFRLRAKLEGKVALGQSCWGERNWIGICGGEWSATWGKGTIVVRFLKLFFFLFCAFYFEKKKKAELNSCSRGRYCTISPVDKMLSS